MKGTSVVVLGKDMEAHSDAYRLLANLMLPDGAEKQLEDWTIFFLNQTPFNTIAPVLALDNANHGDPEAGKQDILYVLNLVRTKHDKSVRRCVIPVREREEHRLMQPTRRGAVVKAMAICTRHPFIQIFKVRLRHVFAVRSPLHACLASIAARTGRLLYNAVTGLSRSLVRCHKHHGYLRRSRSY